MTADRPYVAVVGPGDSDERTDAAAEEVGAELAQAGAVLLSGGLGGAMEAACRGAKRHGGTTVGVLPSADRGAANPYLDVALATGLGEARNALIVRASDAVLAVGGGFGTLSEIALALRTGVPVVGLETWELSRAGVPAEGVVRAGSPADAVARALAET